MLMLKRRGGGGISFFTIRPSPIKIFYRNKTQLNDAVFYIIVYSFLIKMFLLKELKYVILLLM